MNIPNIVQRILLAIVAIPILYFCLRQGGLLLMIAVDIIIFFCLFEFIHLIRFKGFSPNRVLIIVGALAISWDAHFSKGDHLLLILFITLMCNLLSNLVSTDRSTVPIDASLAFFAVFFFGFGTSCLLLIRHQNPKGAEYAFLVFFLIWICDTVAYTVGSTLGRHKLWTQISPKKTVEGTIGGLIGAWAAAFAARLIFLEELTILDCLALGAIAGILGQAGDLVESAFKRAIDVKDSSHFLPGHGGFLDRFDSFLFTAPPIYYYVRFVINS